MSIKLSELAARVGCEIFLPQNLEETDPILRDIAPTATAVSGEITFLTNEKYASYLEGSQASALICPRPLPNVPKPQLVDGNSYALMAKVSQFFYSGLQATKRRLKDGRALAQVAPSAQIGEGTIIAHGATIGEEARIGAGCRIHPGVYVGAEVEIGEGSVLYPNAVVMDGSRIGRNCIVHSCAVVGADGFGFAPTASGIEKIPQRGRVILGDEVEVGALTSIDRGAFEDTVIERGTKLDSHVHVGHGVKVGEYSMICGMVGIAGSSRIGKRFIAAGQSGVAPGISIADNVILGAKAGATRTIEEAGEYMGMPAIPKTQYWRQQAAARSQAELAKRVKELEGQVKALLELNSKKSEL